MVYNKHRSSGANTACAITQWRPARPGLCIIPCPLCLCHLRCIQSLSNTHVFMRYGDAVYLAPRRQPSSSHCPRAPTIKGGAMLGARGRAKPAILLGYPQTRWMRPQCGQEFDTYLHHTLDPRAPECPGATSHAYHPVPHDALGSHVEHFRWAQTSTAHLSTPAKAARCVNFLASNGTLMRPRSALRLQATPPRCCLQSRLRVAHLANGSHCARDRECRNAPSRLRFRKRGAMNVRVYPLAIRNPVVRAPQLRKLGPSRDSTSAQLRGRAKAFSPPRALLCKHEDRVHPTHRRCAIVESAALKVCLHTSGRGAEPFAPAKAR